MGFLQLPGELRNKIYKECIINAGRCRCSDFHEPILDLTRIPQLDSISPLPLMFTNKQISYEITQMLYSSLKPLAIEGYCFNYEEPPFVRTLACWKPFPGGLPRHPYLQNFIRKVDIVIGLEGAPTRYKEGSTYDFRLPQPAKSYVLPEPPFFGAAATELLGYVREFESLSKLRIIIEVPRKSRDKSLQPGLLSELLPFHALCDVQLIMRFELGNRFNDVPSKKMLSDWTNLWIGCLTHLSVPE